LQGRGNHTKRRTSIYLSIKQFSLKQQQKEKFFIKKIKFS